MSISHTHTPNTLKRTHQNTLTTCQNLYTETHDHTHTNTLDLTNIHKHIHLCTPTRTRTHTNRAVFSRHCGFPPSFSPSLPLNDSFVCIWNSTRKQTDRIRKRRPLMRLNDKSLWLTWSSFDLLTFLISQRPDFLLSLHCSKTSRACRWPKRKKNGNVRKEINQRAFFSDWAKENTATTSAAATTTATTTAELMRKVA